MSRPEASTLLRVPDRNAIKEIRGLLTRAETARATLRLIGERSPRDPPARSLLTPSARSHMHTGTRFSPCLAGDCSARVARSPAGRRRRRRSSPCRGRRRFAARRAAAADLAGQTRHRVVAPRRRRRRRQRRRRQRRHPLVQPVQRPAVAPGRPRRHRHHQPGRAALGGRLRHRRSRSRPRPTAPPGPTSTPPPPAPAARRRSPSPAPAATCGCTAPHRGTGYGYSLWEFQVYGSLTGATDAGLRHRPTPRRARPATASSHRGRGRQPRPTPSTATPAPAGPACSATRSGSRSTWARSQSICQVVPAVGGRLRQGLPDPDLGRRHAPGPRLLAPPPAPAAPRRSPSRGTGRYVRMYGTARGHRLRLLAVGVQGLTAAAAHAPRRPHQPRRPRAAAGQLDHGLERRLRRRRPTPRRRRPTGCCAPAPQYPGGAANWGTGEVETASDVDRQRLPRRRRQAQHQGDPGRRRQLDLRPDRDPAHRLRSRRRASRSSSPPCSSSRTWPTALGYWPGFRATGAAYRGNYNNWPGVGETDIMTDVNGRSQLSQTLHCGTAPDGPCAEYNGRTCGLASCAGCQTGYHEYTQVIDRTKTDEEIRFYLDGRQTWVVRESQVGVDRLERGRAPRLLPALRPGHRRLAAERDRRLHHPDRRHHLRRRRSASTRSTVAQADRHHAGRDDRPGHAGRPERGQGHRHAGQLAAAGQRRSRTRSRASPTARRRPPPTGTCAT